jgi:hypothetical protein
MSSTDTEEKSIVVRAAQRRRYTDTNGRTVRRVIRLNGPILSSDLEVARVGDEITLWVEEAPQTQVAIGSLQMIADKDHNGQRSLAPIDLTLPRAAFAEFWAAASVADSALRNITIKFDDAMMEHAITDVVLLEGTPTHPVIAELRFIRRRLQLLLVGLLAAAAVFVVLEALKVAWVFWHQP